VAVPALLVALVLWSTGRSLANGFAFDDVPIIVENAEVHELAPPWVYAQESYWPPKDLGDAYRPWTVWMLGLEWALGGGKPLVFHLVNLLLTIAVTLVLWRLASALLPPAGAAAGAAIFAVHPVHVEATANVVGQAELWMTLFVLLACWRYALARRGGAGPSSPVRLLLAALLVLAAGSKEQGVVLPGLLVLMDFAADQSTPLRARVRLLAPTYLLLAVVLGGFLVGRYLVLGDLGGGPPAEGLANLSAPARAAVMLPLFLHWARLLAWPSVLRAQYSPPEFTGGANWTGAATAGLLLLLTVAVIAVVIWRRYRIAAVGLAWIAIAGSIVSNLAFPTGILIAERTLFLPSVGVALLAGSLFALAGALGWVTLAALVGLGGARSWSRQPVWKDNPTLFAQTVIDAPRSYRSFFVAGKEFQRESKLDLAAAMYSRAASLYEGDPRVFEEWGQVLRVTGRCDLAIPVLERGVEHHRTSTLARSRLFECLLDRGRLADARQVAEAGVALGLTEFKQSLDRVASRERGGADSGSAVRKR
jgi:hypothetical protein